MDLCGKSSGFADCENTENTVDRGSAVIFDADCGLCLSYVGILGPKRNLDRRSSFRLGRYVNEFIQFIYLFFQKKFIKTQGWDCYWNLLYCVIVIKHVAFFTILGEMNSGIHICQFAFEPLHCCFRVWLWFRIWTKILADQRIWRSKGTDRRICIPLFTTLFVWKWDFIHMQIKVIFIWLWLCTGPHLDREA